MSLGISSRLKIAKKNELVKSQSQAQILAHKLKNDGVMGTVESVMQAVDQVATLLASNISDPSVTFRDSIVNLCQHLKVYGAYLEMLYTDQLNHAFNIFRDKAQDDLRVDQISRLHLLELIELRAKGWKGTDGMNQYYRKRASQYTQNDLNESVHSLTDSITSLSLSSSSPILGPGEVLKASGKYNKPTRVTGKKYCKDEVVIRNADSGKVSPGTKERLVQITGANEDSINHAKQLIEDTIRRNASPLRETGASGGPLTGSSSSINSSASDDSALPSSARASRALMHSMSLNDACLGEYKYTVVAGGHTIKIIGDNLDLVKTSKLVLDEYFSGETISDAAQFFSFDSLKEQSLSTGDLTAEAPLSPPESLPSPSTQVLNGQKEETGTYAKLRLPRMSIEEILEKKKTNKPYSYTIEFLAKLAMSPICISPPEKWNFILKEFPVITKQVLVYFDAKEYLKARRNEAIGIVGADSSTESADA